jgi:hypothetical protein
MASFFHFPIEFCPSFHPFYAFCVLSLRWCWSGSALSCDWVSPFCCQVLLSHKWFHWFADGCPSIFWLLLSLLSVRYSFCDQISADFIFCRTFLSIGAGCFWSGSAWLPLVTAVQNGLPLSLNEFVRCLSKVPARPIGVYNLLGVVYLSFDWCWPPCNCSCFLAGWLLLPSNQDGFYYEYLSLLSEIGLPFIGPASPCFPCRYHCSIKMNNDATPT